MHTTDQLPMWVKVWRKGFAPIMPTKGLLALEEALEKDDPRLLQGATTLPPPLSCVQERPVEAACAVTYCGWQGADCDLVAEAEEFFARACFDCDVAMGVPADCRWFLNWFDETPRDEMRRLLLTEVKLELDRRED